MAGRRVVTGRAVSTTRVTIAPGPCIDYEFVEALREEMTCSICMKVLCNPHLVNCCEQQFCEGCLMKWLQSKSTCPHCRSVGFKSMLMTQKSRKIGELKVYCSNKQHGCKAELKINEYDNHLSTVNDKGCAYVKLACPNDCDAKVLRGEMVAHTSEVYAPNVLLCAFTAKLKENTSI